MVTIDLGAKEKELREKFPETFEEEWEKFIVTEWNERKKILPCKDCAFNPENIGGTFKMCGYATSCADIEKGVCHHYWKL